MNSRFPVGLPISLGNEFSFFRVSYTCLSSKDKYSFLSARMPGNLEYAQTGHAGFKFRFLKSSSQWLDFSYVLTYGLSLQLFLLGVYIFFIQKVI